MDARMSQEIQKVLNRSTDHMRTAPPSAFANGANGALPPRNPKGVSGAARLAVAAMANISVNGQLEVDI